MWFASVFLLPCEHLYLRKVSRSVLSKEAEFLTDASLEIKARPLACKVSERCPLSKVGGNGA